MSASTRREILTARAPDGATVRVQLHLPARADELLFWLPALGVGIGPYESFADAIAVKGTAVAILEWRGLGQSDRRASRGCDWGYRELLDADVPAALDAVSATVGALPLRIGGHSLGGQLALIHAARCPDQFRGVWLVASGQPWWRGFGGWRGLGVLAFAAAIPGVTALVGHFPGTRLGFAGREARRLMCDWAGTAIRGDYRVPGFGDELDRALADHAGVVNAVRMSDDWLAPATSLDHLRGRTPQSRWTIAALDRTAFAKRRADHFGWLREPDAVVDALLAASGAADGGHASE